MLDMSLSSTRGQSPLDIAIVGGGINGLCCAWTLAEHGHKVTLFERGKLMAHTSSASTKLLHGGLRYLENFHFRLVREALRERAWWLANVPELTQPVELFLPVSSTSPRPAWLLGLGLWLYDRLAGSAKIQPFRYLDHTELKAQTPEIRHADLSGGFRFFDGQMDDYALGLWVADRARESGARLVEHAEVSRVSTDGRLSHNGETSPFDRIFNVAGPWAETLLRESGVTSRYRLQLVRGSHILFEEPIDRGYFLQVPGEKRIFFVLPYKGRTLVGTTEEPHSLETPIRCSEQEAEYLVGAYNVYFRERESVSDIRDSFAGVRPLIRSAANPSRLSREYAIERRGKLITVFGGKWTTSRALAHRVSHELD
jgi:glycerol-3-phosphate dehydrogenase